MALVLLGYNFSGKYIIHFCDRRLYREARNECSEPDSAYVTNEQDEDLWKNERKYNEKQHESEVGLLFAAI